MERQSHTPRPIQINPGQHVALAVAAQLAGSQLVPDPGIHYDTKHLLDSLNRVGAALAKVAPLYVHDARSTEPRGLTPAELEGAAVRQGATQVVLRDGRTLSGVTLKRVELRQAIAILKSIAVQGLLAPPAPTPSGCGAPERFGDLAARMAELEHLLRSPLAPTEWEKASRLATSIARSAPHGRVANCAMQLMSAFLESRDIELALARLRAALAESRSG